MPTCTMSLPYGTLIPGKPPLYVAIYVEDFIYFSAADAVETHFETSPSALLHVDFMGPVK